MNMMRLRAAVVLLRVIKIQDYLLARREFAQQRKTTFQLKLHAGGESIAVPHVEARVVVSLGGTIRRERASPHAELPLERHSIAIAKREVAVDEAPVLAIAIAQQDRQRQILAKRLLRDDAMLFERVVTGREAVAIAVA